MSEFESTENPTIDEEIKYYDVDGTSYGHELKKKYFLLGQNLSNLNHGSFGTVPKEVNQAQQNYFFEQESHLDHWFRETYFKYIESARVNIAKLVHANPNDIVLVENASAAVNSVLRSHQLKKGDRILRLSTAYGMVIHTLNWLESTVGIEVIVVDITYPVKDEVEIIQEVSKAYLKSQEENNPIKLAIFSHISSMPSMIEPVKELTCIAHSFSSMVMIDAAHAPGVIYIDIEEIQPDYYLGNCHKWLFSPKGTAFMYVAKKHQTLTSPEPTVISSSGDLSFLGRYKYTGTRDYTAFAALPDSLRFINDKLGGLQRVRSYNKSLMHKSANYLVNAWKTSLLVPLKMSGFMFNVILPSQDENAIIKMQSELDKKHNIYMVFSYVTSESGEKIFFTRLSSQIYLEFSEFKNFADLVLIYLKP